MSANVDEVPGAEWRRRPEKRGAGGTQASIHNVGHLTPASLGAAPVLCPFRFNKIEPSHTSLLNLYNISEFIIFNRSSE